MSYKKPTDTEIRKMNERFLEKHFEKRIARASLFAAGSKSDLVRAIKTGKRKKRKGKK